jgi:hypothetical protein
MRDEARFSRRSATLPFVPIAVAVYAVPDCSPLPVSAPGRVRVALNDCFGDPKPASGRSGYRAALEKLDLPVGSSSLVDEGLLPICSPSTTAVRR